ncbi:MAG TPA: hypothetical protein VJU87_07980 [Gemmatimonadaceae bacterium]|nr:hypothetical protein [Gemmatimonadaceae bacterium]
MRPDFNASIRRTVLLLGTAAAVIGACSQVSAGRTHDSAAAGDRAVQDTSYGPLRFHAVVEVTRDSLLVTVTMRNQGAAPVRLEWGACAMSPRLYETAGLSRPPVYDWLGRSTTTPPGAGGRACPLYLALHTLAPGDTLAPRELRVAVAAAELRQKNVRPDRYEAAAGLRIGGMGEAGARADTLVIPIGPVQLSR